MTQRTEAHMRSSDAFSWYMERDPELRSTVVTVTELETAPDWDRLVAKLDRASRILPHFRQRVVEPPLRLATPRWTNDDEFDLSWHLRRERVAKGGGRAEVLDFARRKATTAFDPARPLWELTVLEGLRGGGAAVVLKIHHSLTDGVGGMEMAMEVFDLEEHPSESTELPAAPPGEPVPGLVRIVTDAVATRADQFIDLVEREVRAAVPMTIAAVRHPAATVGHLVDTVASIARTVAPVSTTLSPAMTDRHLGRRLATIDVPLDGLRTAAHDAGATVNDAFLAAVSGGLRLYHEAMGLEVEELRITLPINIRKPGDPIGGNRITLQRYLVPALIRDPGERMREIGRRTRAARDEPSLPLTNGIAAGLNMLPPSYIGSMLKHVDFLASNVPGPPVPIYLAGARVATYYPFGPTIGAAVNLTLLSYCGTCYVGLNIDTAAVPDTDQFVACLRAGFEEVAA